MQSDLVDLNLIWVRESDKAICVADPDGEDSIWLPKSQVEFVRNLVRGQVEVTLPRWLAKEKGLVE